MDLNCALSRAIKLGQDHRLPVAERDFAVSHRERERVSQHHRAKVRIGIFAAALGNFGIIVAPVIESTYQAFEKILDVIE